MALQATPETPQPQKLTDTGQYCGPLWLPNDKKHHPFQKVGNAIHHRAEQGGTTQKKGEHICHHK